jgi:hypothetical protein
MQSNSQVSILDLYTDGYTTESQPGHIVRK